MFPKAKWLAVAFAAVPSIAVAAPAPGDSEGTSAAGDAASAASTATLDPGIRKDMHVLLRRP